MIGANHLVAIVPGQVRRGLQCIGDASSQPARLPRSPSRAECFAAGAGRALASRGVWTNVKTDAPRPGRKETEEGSSCASFWPFWTGRSKHCEACYTAPVRGKSDPTFPRRGGDLSRRSSRAIQPQKCLGPDPENQRHRPRRLFGIDLGRTGAAVFEEDRRLANAAAGFAAAVEHFLLERVTA